MNENVIIRTVFLSQLAEDNRKEQEFWENAGDKVLASYHQGKAEVYEALVNIYGK